jgi:hypothetical protein
VQARQAGCNKIVDHVVPDIAARPAADDIGHNRAGITCRSQGGPMRTADFRLFAAQERGPQLHCARAQYERGCRGAPSAMPPAAMTGTLTASTICGSSENNPGCMPISQR